MKQNHPSTNFVAPLGLDWADKKHDVWLRPADGGQPEHRVIQQTPEALHEWVAQMLQVLHQSIDELETLIEKTTDLHPEAALFRSFPCAGPALARRLLVAFGTNRARFESAQEVPQFYGLAPVRQQSGQSEIIHLRYRCPKFVRQTFHENAGHVVRKEGWAKTFYEQQRAKKKGHHACVRAAAFKLMRIYFRRWKDNKCYDANLYEEALKKHGSGLASQLKKTDPTNGE